MPTGVAIRDPRRQLLEAADRVLRRDGPNALTSRAVTTEADCAKGVLHRHFTDFNVFLAELVRDRIARLEHQAGALRDAAGTGTVAGNVADALFDLFDPVALGVLGLVTSRHDLLARLRATTPTGIPVLTEATAMIVSYLAAERDLGRLAPDADVATVAPMLVGTGHLLFAGREPPPSRDEVRRAVTTALAGIAPEPTS